MSSTYEFDTDRYAGSGIFIKGIAGEVVGNRKLVYMGPLGTWLLADADLAATLPALGLTLSGAAFGGRIRILLKGFVGDTTWTWVVGTEMYASSIPGELTQVPAGLVQGVGMAGPSTDFIYFNGDLDTGAAATVCALLEGATAYVGFDVCKGAAHTNYFTCDGVDDYVQIQQAIDYVIGLSGGSVELEIGDYDLNTTGITIHNHAILLRGQNSDPGSSGTVLTYTGVGVAITVTNVALRLFRTKIQDLLVIATGNATTNATAYGIEIDSVDGATIERVNVSQFAEGRGVNITCRSDSISAQVHIDKLFTFNCKIGIYLEGNQAGNEVNVVTITEPVLIGPPAKPAGSYGIFINEFSHNNLVIGGDVETFLVGFHVEGDNSTLFNTRTEDISGIHINVAANALRNKLIKPFFVGGGAYCVDAGFNTQVPSVWDGVVDPTTTLGRHRVLDLPDNTDTHSYGELYIPFGYQQLLTCDVIVVAAASGNMVWTVDTDFARLCLNEDYNRTSDSDTGTDALVTPRLECIDISAALTGLEAGCIVGVDFMRDGDAGGDTIGDSVYYKGIRMRYV